jgi:hypothetical protein
MARVNPTLSGVCGSNLRRGTRRRSGRPPHVTMRARSSQSERFWATHRRCPHAEGRMARINTTVFETETSVLVVQAYWRPVLTAAIGEHRIGRECADSK